jgi:hypothetical protein
MNNAFVTERPLQRYAFSLKALYISFFMEQAATFFLFVSQFYLGFSYDYFFRLFFFHDSKAGNLWIGFMAFGSGSDDKH